MGLFKLNGRRIEALEKALCIPAIFALAKAIDSVYGVMCDPAINVAGAPPFGTTSLYGMPVWFLSLLVMGFSLVAIEQTLPAVSRFMARYRLVIFVGSILLALALPMLPFPHRVLGACRG